MARILLLTTLAVVALGCQASTSGAPLPPGPSIVKMTLDEYSFQYEPPPRSGRVVIEVRNEGARHHEVVLLRLPEDFPSIEKQLASEDRKTLFPVYSLPALSPSEEAKFAVDLKPGRYGLMCFEPVDDETHAHKGMHAEFHIQR